MTTPSIIESDPLYRDASRGIPERVADLLARMTLAEKAAQLGSAWVFELAAGTDLVEGAGARMADGLGQVTRIAGASTLVPTEAATVANRIQRLLVEDTRLGIPAIMHEEVCAGLMAREATVFPQPIGLASTWNPALVEQMAAVVRTEMRAMGSHQGLSPVLDICRDPRWGRIEETFGEDPHLVAAMGVAFVRGLQGESLADGVVATAKHFVGYGASEGGLNWAPAHIPPLELAEVYLHPFEAAVRTAGLRSIMNGYHELDGMPCGADRDLLTGLLRQRWGFDGYVVADYFSIRQLEDYHRLAADGAEAAAIALGAGIDVELPSTDCYGRPLIEAVEAGVVDEAELDRSVARVLRTKFELGLFEEPYVAVDAVAPQIGAAPARQLAGRLATESMVLLANDGCLPLDPATTATVAVIGPNADNGRNLHGDYGYTAHVETLVEMRETENVFAVPVPDDLRLEVSPLATTTVAAALADRLPAATVVTAPGCDVTDPDRSGLAEAVRVAAEADVAVVVVGDRSGLISAATCGEGRDRSSLALPGIQEELVAAVLDTGTPVVLVLVAGRPCGTPAIHERSAAVLAAWLPGTAGGEAVADVLCGRAVPGGKLPVSFPRSAGHLPVYYRHKVSGGRSHWKGDYVDGPVGPLYPFGHGLSYTSFALTAAQPAPAVIAVTGGARDGGTDGADGDGAGGGGAVTLEVEVINTGDRSGDEVVQLYFRDPRASLTRPVLELISFARVGLEPGQTTTVTFTVPVAQLGFRDRDLRYIVEPGEIELHVGTSSNDLIAAGSFTITTDDGGSVPVDEVFAGGTEVRAGHNGSASEHGAMVSRATDSADQVIDGEEQEKS